MKKELPTILSTLLTFSLLMGFFWSIHIPRESLTAHHMVFKSQRLTFPDYLPTSERIIYRPKS